MLHLGSWFLRRSVLLRGIRLGEVEDVLLDAACRRVIGFVILCGDGERRMLPLSAVDTDAGDGAVGVSSALVLMEDGFYRGRGRTLTALFDAGVRRGGITIGTLSDLRFDEAGCVRLFVIDGLGEVAAGEDLSFDVEAHAAAN